MRAFQPSSLLPKFLTATLPLILNLSSCTSLSTTRSFRSPRVSLFRRFSLGCRFFASATGGSGAGASRDEDPSLEFLANTFPIPGSEDALLSFVNGKRKATDIAHLATPGGGARLRPDGGVDFSRGDKYIIWKNIIRVGDTVVDATCGNGYDTLALLKLIADDSRRGCVHGFDVQNCALESTSYLLREFVIEEQRELVKLSLLCHSRMEDILPKDTSIRLIAFNLGYLPGGDKTIITKPHTTLLALQAAGRIIASGGLISIVVYVGHPGGREESEAVLSFVSSLPEEGWNSFKFETANRTSGPVLVFIFKK